eukprot:m.295400 g.295400  ORF g.295400 m.295400 type:complete len:95 (+) comp16260_c0_seq3:235-519(+)
MPRVGFLGAVAGAAVAVTAAALLTAGVVGWRPTELQPRRRRRRPTMFLTCGPSGSGKDTLLLAAHARFSSGWSRLHSRHPPTTLPPSPARQSLR